MAARTSRAALPRVEYEPTANGRTLPGPAVTLAEWALEHNTSIERSKQAVDSGEV